MPYSYLHAQMMAGVCSCLPPSCTHWSCVCSYLPVPPLNFPCTCLHLSLPAGARSHLPTPGPSWAVLPPFPRPGASGATHMTQPRAQMSDWQECPFLDTTSGARKFGVPQSTLGGITGAQEGWGQSRPTLAHPESPLGASRSPVAAASWAHPGGQPQVSDLHFHVLVQEEVTCRGRVRGGGWEGEEHGVRGGIPALATPPPRPRDPFPALTELQVPVDDAPLVQVAQAADQAPQVVTHLRLCQRLPRLQHVGQ